MRSKVTPEQFAELQAAQSETQRALALAEATLLLLRERESQYSKVSDLLSSYTHNSDIRYHALVDQLTKMHDKLDQLATAAAVPRGDYPTMDELVAEAKSDPVKRKLFEATLAELEFENTEIEFN